MKICFITEHYDKKYGGQYTSVKSVIDICKILKISNWIVSKNSKNFKNKKILKKIIKSSDIIHIFGGWTIFYVKINLMMLGLNKKIVIHPMGFYEPWSLSQKRLKKYFAWNLYQKQLLLKANLIHCASSNEANSLKKLHNDFKTKVLPFGISKNTIKKNIKTKLNKRCLFFSRLHKKKGLDKLIKAWIDVKDENWSLDIIGYGDAEYYRKKFNIYNHDKIKFLNPIFSDTKKINTFEKYDLLILPSSNENFGIVVLEAMARGLAVLTTNETPWNIIQKENAGWIINDSIIELKIVLSEIFRSSEKNIKKKKINALKIASKFTKENLSKIYLNTYKKILSY